MVTRDEVLDVLRGIYDPEIPINIYDLGLVYRVEVKEGGVVEIDMTLTAAGCPIGPAIVDVVRTSILMLEGVKSVEVHLVYDPPWTPSRATEEGRLMLQAMGIPV